MKRLVWFSVFLLCSGWFAAGQSRVVRSGKARTQESSSSSGYMVEAGPTGCLEEKGGTFRLAGYILKGHEKELAGHNGDEVRVTGTMVLPQGLPMGRFYPPLTINVKSVKILHVNNPAGRAPVLGPVAGWKTISNRKYGIRFRVPKTFTRLNPRRLYRGENFLSSEGTETIGAFSFPAAVYPNTNFMDGRFALFVNPGIHSGGSCLQFNEFRPKLTSLRTVQGILFSHTLLGGLAGPMSSYFHFLHVYQNGLCYEFNFDFNVENSTALGSVFCSVQWINAKNESQLTDAVLSAVRFVRPEFHPPKPAKPLPTQPPIVSSFDQTPVHSHFGYGVRVTWATEGADYVQFHWPCTRNVFVSGAGRSCWDNGPFRNFPPAGHINVGLQNFNKALVTLKFTIEPFRAGVGYPKQSKTLTFTVKPQPLPPAGNR